MNFSKYLSVILASILAIFITYYSVVLLDCNEPSTGAKKVAYVFTVFSIVYTSGKLAPLVVKKLISTSEKLVEFIVKG